NSVTTKLKFEIEDKAQLCGGANDPFGFATPPTDADATDGCLVDSGINDIFLSTVGCSGREKRLPPTPLS
ncbi:hypothetical protein A2U01_0015544, partial [Trifolium medium]|nr:hypothetical protein [Trifolium medium]